MQITAKPLKPLQTDTLTEDERKMLSWLRRAEWEPQKDKREPIPYRARVPEFAQGVRLYRMQAGGASMGSLGALDLFIKKLEYQGALTKQELYPVSAHGSVRYLSLTKADLDNLGVGKADEEED